MKAQLSQQDLTDYALNELEPAERLYVESLLAVSEECRNDIYQTIDVAMMIEKGFEQQDVFGEIALTDEQRTKLLTLPVPNYFLRHTAAVLAAAACAAFALVHRDVWLPKGPAQHVARVSGQFSTYMEAMASSDGDDFVSHINRFRRLADDPAFKKWFPAQPVAVPAGWNAGSATSWDAAPHSSLDLIP